MWGWPNKEGDFTIGIRLKLEGERSYAYFKDNFEEFA